MKKILFVTLLTLLLCLCCASAMAATITFTPSSAVIFEGESFTFDYTTVGLPDDALELWGYSSGCSIKTNAYNNGGSITVTPNKGSYKGHVRLTFVDDKHTTKYCEATFKFTVEKAPVINFPSSITVNYGGSLTEALSISGMNSKFKFGNISIVPPTTAAFSVTPSISGQKGSIKLNGNVLGSGTFKIVLNIIYKGRAKDIYKTVKVTVKKALPFTTRAEVRVNAQKRMVELWVFMQDGWGLKRMTFIGKFDDPETEMFERTFKLTGQTRTDRHYSFEAPGLYYATVESVSGEKRTFNLRLIDFDGDNHADAYRIDQGDILTLPWAI